MHFVRIDFTKSDHWELIRYEGRRQITTAHLAHQDLKAFHPNDVRTTVEHFRATGMP